MRAFVTILRMGAVAALLLAGSAGAKDHGRGEHGGGRRAWAVPEFDAASAGAIAIVLAGGAIVVARRRRR